MIKLKIEKNKVEKDEHGAAEDLMAEATMACFQMAEIVQSVMKCSFEQACEHLVNMMRIAIVDYKESRNKK